MILAIVLLAAQSAPSQAPATSPAPAPAAQLLPVQRPGLVVLRGSDAAPLPDAVVEAARTQGGPLRLVLRDGSGADEQRRDPHELALVPHDWIADAPATIERIAHAEAYEFVGGSPYRLLEALYPKKSESRAIQVLRERHRLGRPVIGTGAGAGFVSALSFGLVAERERKERNPRRTDPVASLWTLSILPWALVATDVETAGDFEPFTTALIERHIRTAIFLAPRATLTVDLERGEALVSGSGGVWLFDLKRARRDRTGFQDGRLSRLAAGDAWNVRSRDERLADGALFVPERRLGEPLPVQRALATESLRLGLAQFVHGEDSLPRIVRVVGPDAEWTLTIDADTRLVARTAEEFALADLRIDLRLAPGHTRP
ncbi:MAG: hypothetical protein L6Q99_01440 [Planctomycetes bacterium]|nr:hypothetical protein [Planctomycetota bacterium]